VEEEDVKENGVACLLDMIALMMVVVVKASTPGNLPISTSLSEPVSETGKDRTRKDSFRCRRQVFQFHFFILQVYFFDSLIEFYSE